MARNKDKGKSRYPSGKIRREDVRAPALWRRVQTLTARKALDPRMGTEIGRLSLFKIITSAEAAAGFRFAEVVGRYHWAISSKPFSAPSPSYELGFRGEALGETAPGMPSEVIAEIEEMKTTAENEHAFMARIVPGGVNGPAMRFLERVCCENETLDEKFHHDLSVMLRKLAIAWGML